MRHATKAHYKAAADRDLFLGWLATFAVGGMAGSTLTLLVMRMVI